MSTRIPVNRGGTMENSATMKNLLPYYKKACAGSNGADPSKKCYPMKRNRSFSKFNITSRCNERS
jgi:hypothetical protein